MPSQPSFSPPRMPRFRRLAATASRRLWEEDDRLLARLMRKRRAFRTMAMSFTGPHPPTFFFCSVC